MKLFIPPLKTELKLTSAWTFDLYPERRNRTLFDLMGISYTDPWRWRDQQGISLHFGTLPPPVSVTLPRGSVLIVDRIYIRQNNEEFDSISFMLKSMPNATKIAKNMPGKSAKTLGRFWAKLDDCNGINVQVLTGEESPKEKV